MLAVTILHLTGGIAPSIDTLSHSSLPPPSLIHSSHPLICPCPLHLTPQVNAHSALLSSMALKATVWSSSFYGALVGFQRFLKAQCRDWLRNVVNLVTYR